ncbi:MAG TPA: TatD family hydrolase [Roseiarcus sp.]|nr:TatD family hydrolase [Roseiarcus sp.]
MTVIDSHCHLDFPDFAEELDAIVARARAAGVERMVTISTRIARGGAYQALAERFAEVYFSIGTHPHQAAEEADIDAEAVRRYAAHPKCVAIGEAGLDYHYNYAPADVAERVFRAQIGLARELKLPLVIHARDADADVARILREETAAGRFTALLHCFTSSRGLAETGLELGLYISFSGVLTFKNSADLRAIARDVPLDRVLVETDAPYLAPVPHRGKRNEPSFVVDTARMLAEAKGVGFDRIAAATRANTLRVFAKMDEGRA